MDTTQIHQTEESIEYPLFYTKEGEVPFWDNPLIRGFRVLPKKYKPYTTIEAALNLYLRNRVDDKDMMILKVLGDSICSNEDQLRRYLSSQMSRSETSKKLDKLRSLSMADRWKIRLREDKEELIRPPAPFTLGIAGFKLLKHYYNESFFMNPNHWDEKGIGAIQRYVAMNELRCRLVEANSIRQWEWNAIVNNNPRIKRPLGTAEVKTPKGNLNFIIDRAQMSQNFLGFLKEKLYQWKLVYEKKGYLPVGAFPENPTSIILFTSTLSMAQFLHQELMLDTYPFNVMVCVEEDMLTEGVSTAFYRAKGEELVRMRLSFLENK